ncbi:hypothetical protein [Caudoviricetes sp.]|nr:hypothetical protein [Caudoviricetes sp.]
MAPNPTLFLVERWQSPINEGGEEHLTKASTAITKGRLLSVDSNGYVVHASTGDRVLGVALESKSSSLATTTPIAIDYIKRGDKFRVQTTGAASQTKVGEECDIDNSTGKIDLTASTNDDVAVFNILGTGTNDTIVTFLKTY